MSRIVDLDIHGRRGRIVYPVMAAGGVLGIGLQLLYAVSIDALPTSEGDDLVLEAA